MASIIKTAFLLLTLATLTACTTITERSDSPNQEADNRNIPLDEEIDRQISKAQRDEQRAKRLLLILLEELRQKR